MRTMLKPDRLLHEKGCDCDPSYTRNCNCHVPRRQHAVVEACRTGILEHEALSWFLHMCIVIQQQDGVTCLLGAGSGCYGCSTIKHVAKIVCSNGSATAWLRTFRLTICKARRSTRPYRNKFTPPALFRRHTRANRCGTVLHEIWLCNRSCYSTVHRSRSPEPLKGFRATRSLRAG